MDKKIITIVSLVLALIFITALTLIFSNVNNLSEEAGSELTITSNVLDDTRLARYDGTVVSGSEVKYAITKMTELPDGTKMSFLVRNLSASNSSGDAYGWDALYWDTSSASVKMSGIGNFNIGYHEASQKNTSGEIDNSSKYKSTLCRDYRGKVIGIYFLKTT